MKTAIIYYSYTGNTKKWAAERAQKETLDLIEVCEQRHRSTVNAYICGSLAARRRRNSKINPLTNDLSAYDRVILAAPVWAGYPATPFNNMVHFLPTGKEVEVVMISGSGNSKGSAQKTKEMIQKAGCKVIAYKDIKDSAL